MLSVPHNIIKLRQWRSSSVDVLAALEINTIIGGFAKRAHPARARYLNVNLSRRNRDLQPGGKEIEGGGRGGGGGEGGEK